MTVIVVNGHPRSSNPRSYTDEVAPHWMEYCPVHRRLVAFTSEGRLIGRCDLCAAEAAAGIRHIEETAA